MAHPETEGLIGRVEREAERHDIDLDAVRTIDTDADGTTLRVLETDAEDEADQVGFDITKPPGQIGDDMFGRNLKEGMRELRKHLRDGSNSDDSDAEDSSEQPNVSETPDVDPREEGVQSEHQQEESLTRSQPLAGSEMNLAVSIDDNSLEQLREEFEGFLEDVDEATVDHDRVDELEDRLDDVDSRLSSIEEKLSLLALGDPNQTEESTDG